MAHRISNLFKILIITVPIILLNTRVSLADPPATATPVAYGADYASSCAELESIDWSKAPSPMAIICPVVRLLNVLVLSAAAIFVIFIFITSIKYAMSQGDPKALQASAQTLKTAIIGFFLVIGVYTILTIIKNVLGLEGEFFPNPFPALSKNLAALLMKFGVRYF